MVLSFFERLVLIFTAIILVIGIISSRINLYWYENISHSKLSELGIHSIYDKYALNGIVFTHEMIPDLDQYQISGHFHVGVEIQLPTKNKIRLPAFYISEKNLLLPAFCSFTGLDTRNHINSKNIYAIYKNEILAL